MVGLHGLPAAALTPPPPPAPAVAPHAEAATTSIAPSMGRFAAFKAIVISLAIHIRAMSLSFASKYGRIIRPKKNTQCSRGCCTREQNCGLILRNKPGSRRQKTRRGRAFASRTVVFCRRHRKQIFTNAHGSSARVRAQRDDGRRSRFLMAAPRRSGASSGSISCRALRCQSGRGCLPCTSRREVPCRSRPCPFNPRSGACA